MRVVNCCCDRRSPEINLRRDAPSALDRRDIESPISLPPQLCRRQLHPPSDTLIRSMTATATDQRAYNFSAGPAVLPVQVLEEVRDELLCLPGARCSLLEMSHRDKEFIDILHDAENSIRSLMSISDDYAVLFLQGGAALQFSMIPANLLRDSGKRAAKAEACGNIAS